MRSTSPLLVLASAIAMALAAAAVGAQPAADPDTARYQQTDQAFDRAKQQLDRALAAAHYETDRANYRPTGDVRSACGEFLAAQRAWLEARHSLGKFNPDLCARMYTDVPEQMYQLRQRRTAFDEARTAAGNDTCASALRSAGTELCDYYERHKDDRWTAIALTTTRGDEVDLCARFRTQDAACGEQGQQEPPPTARGPAPTLRIVTPSEGDVFTPRPGKHETITVELDVEDGDGDLSSLELRRESDEGVHDETVAARAGQRRYSFRTPLRAGVNTIEVTAVDRAGHRTTARVNVIEDEATPSGVTLHISTIADNEAHTKDIVAVPGRVRLIVRAKDAAGAAVTDGYVRLAVDGARFAALRFDSDKARSDHLTGNARLDGSGTYTAAIETTLPQSVVDYDAIASVPLTVTVNATLTRPGSDTAVAQARRELPFNLAVIHGTTVDPEMVPRTEAEPPRADVGKTKQKYHLDAERHTDGEFWVLVRPLHPIRLEWGTGAWQLVWSEACRLPLELALEEAPRAGRVLEAGLVDVLTPSEHEARFRKVLKSFIEAMSLPKDAETELLGHVDELELRYGAKALAYYDNLTSASGVVLIPGSPVDYWARRLRVNSGREPPYFVMIHELGHFLHHALVEPHARADVPYKSATGYNHAPWKPPFKGNDEEAAKQNRLSDKARRYTSFAESAADFFAVALRSHWIDENRAIQFSPYFKRIDYGTTFDTDARALAVVQGGERGDHVEGVQTRFLVALYGWDLVSRPAEAYADYLRGMARYLDLRAYYPWPPARTMQQWVRAQAGRSPLLEDRDIVGIAARYGIRPEADDDHAGYVSPWQGSETAPVVVVDGKQLAFRLPAAEPVPLDSTVRVVSGKVVIDLSTADDHRIVILEAGSTIVIRADRSIAVSQGSGKIVVDGKVEAVAADATITPTGTAYAIAWPAGKDAEVWTLQGTVTIAGGDGTRTVLSAGDSATVAPGGAVTSRGTFDLERMRTELIGDAPSVAIEALLVTDDDAGTAMVWLFFGGLLAGVLAFVGVSHLRAKRRARGARGAAGHGARRTG